MKKQFSLVLFYIVTFGCAFGQDYTFSVLASQGQNKVRTADGDLLSLKIGLKLHNPEVLITSDDAHVMLAHESGKILHIKGLFEEKVGDLGLKVEWENSKNVVMTNPSFVEVTEVPLLAVLLPGKSTNVYGDQAIIRWKALAEVSEGDVFTVTIVNIFDDVIHQEQTKSTFFTLNFDEIDNVSGLYIFRVTQSGHQKASSDYFGIKKLSGADRPDVVKGLKSTNFGSTEISANERLQLAKFFEDHLLILDALTQYEIMLQQAPEDKDLRVKYDDFLARNVLAMVIE